MTNIWEFLLQTVEVSFAAAILLLLKGLLADKLSPRWQYGVWILLAGKLLLPARVFGKYMSLRLATALEAAKAMGETHLHSSFTDPYTPVGGAASGFPYVPGNPVSLTDWIFVVYLGGVLVWILCHIVSYVRLRMILKRGNPIGQELAGKIDAVCKQYSLKPCKTVAVEGIHSAFVCGAIRPILAVPVGNEEGLDEKIILHELLHRKHFDALQSIFWCLMRGLHWCNPFLQYVFNRVGNDMESLCDQRVLENLEGEERRAYGRILLAMTNEQYARAPGTTSLSNGGKNIARRIQAIARFKKYPKGMALVSVCIVIMLAAPIFGGTEDEDYDGQYPESVSPYPLHMSMAKSRTRRCSTPAGAIDTWVKGRVFNQPVYVAAASPLEDQKKLLRQMERKEDFSAEVKDILNKEGFSGYFVVNLEERGSDSYSATIVLAGQGETEAKALAAPITVRHENGWVVRLAGKPHWIKVSDGSFLGYGDSALPYLMTSQGKGKSGTITIKEQYIYQVDNQKRTDSSGLFEEDTGFDQKAKPDAQFSFVSRDTYTAYQNRQSEAKRSKIRHAAVMIAPLDRLEDEVTWEYDKIDVSIESSGSSNSGQFFATKKIDGSWDGALTDQSGLGSDLEPGEEITYPAGYLARIYLDGKLIETIKVKRGARL